MDIMLGLSTLAVSSLVFGTAGVGGIDSGGLAIQTMVDLLRSRFGSQGSRLVTALRRANQRAWRTLEMALAGDSFWQRCRTVLTSADEKALRRELQAYFQALQLPQADPTRFCRQCVAELRSAQKQGLLDHDRLDPARLAENAGQLLQFRETQSWLNAEKKILLRVSEALRHAGYTHLAELIDLQPCSDQTLLTASVRFFFRRAVEEDRELFQSLAFSQLESIQHEQQHQFEAIQGLLTQYGDRLENLLDELQAGVWEIHSTVLDVRQEQQRQAGRHEELYQAVIDLQRRLDLMHRNLRPRDSLSIRGDVEKRLVRELVKRIRSLPEDQRQDMPALLNAVGMLQVAAGDFQPAQHDFMEVAQVVHDTEARAEAHYNAYRACLERRDWIAALDSLNRAVQLDRPRFEPFPWRKYRPERILGAGGFGVAFLCRHTRIDVLVVVKTLNSEDLERDLTDIFNEARALRQIAHPNIIGLRDCDFADDEQSRAYIEMDYFESESLEAYIGSHGCLSEADLIDLARQWAEGLRAAHEHGILHRDVKPGNILVRREGKNWLTKLIDFGLAVHRDLMVGSTASESLRGRSIAGTIDYAAPEQMGKMPGVPVDRASDVFGFARTCYFALFGTPYPKAKHFDRLTPAWRNLLDDCTNDDPRERPADFNELLKRWPGTRSAVPVAPTMATPITAGQLWSQIVDQTRGLLKSAFATHTPLAKPVTEKPSRGVASDDSLHPEKEAAIPEVIQAVQTAIPEVTAIDDELEVLPVIPESQPPKPPT